MTDERSGETDNRGRRDNTTSDVDDAIGHGVLDNYLGLHGYGSRLRLDEVHTVRCASHC